jgi:hypothetical protein
MFIENKHICYRFQIYSSIFKDRCRCAIKWTGHMKNRSLAVKMQIYWNQTFNLSQKRFSFMNSKQICFEFKYYEITHAFRGYIVFIM